MTLIEIDPRRRSQGNRRSLRDRAGLWARTALIGLIGAAAIVLLALAALAVTVIGLAIAAAALTLRFTRRRARNEQTGPVTLEARRAPDGWAAEPPRA